jgi:hypothetical protein
MAIIMHPLTALNGSPEYTANDYRHAINPLLVPSDGTAFNGLSGIRYGSPSPLVTVSGLTVTVKPHCGTISPWDGLGAYTYAITTNTTVQLADSTNNYKIAVTVEDPSQSHGTTPRGKLEVFTAGTSDSNINGLVIAEVNAGVASDVAPIIRNNAVLMARDLNQLNTIAAMDGQKAITIADNTHYVMNNDTWGLDVPRYVKTNFRRSDNSLNLNNNATTYMNQTIVGNTLGASIRTTGKGQAITLKRGLYLLIARVQLQTVTVNQWVSIGIDTSGINVIGPGSAESSTSGSGFSGIQMTSALLVNSSDAYVSANALVSGNSSMRTPGEMLIMELR